MLELCFCLSNKEVKISGSKLICYFYGHPAAFGFQASLPPDNVTLNPVNKRIDQNLSDFQTGIFAAAHTTLETDQVISHTRTALVDTIASLQHYECGVITASEVSK